MENNINDKFISLCGIDTSRYIYKSSKGKLLVTLREAFKLFREEVYNNEDLPELGWDTFRRFVNIYIRRNKPNFLNNENFIDLFYLPVLPDNGKETEITHVYKFIGYTSGKEDFLEKLYHKLKFYNNTHMTLLNRTSNVAKMIIRLINEHEWKV